MPNDGRQIANHIIEVAEDHGNHSLDIMTLLKLAYFAHGRCLARHEQALVTDSVEAWKYGPVIPSIYFGFRPHGVDNVEQLRIIPEEIGDNGKKVIRNVYRHYRNYSGGKLSGITHKRDGPWYRIYHSLGEGSVIPNELIREYFKEHSYG